MKIQRKHSVSNLNFLCSYIGYRDAYPIFEHLEASQRFAFRFLTDRPRQFLFHASFQGQALRHVPKRFPGK